MYMGQSALETFKYSLVHFKSNVQEYSAKRTIIVQLSKYLWTAVYIYIICKSYEDISVLYRIQCVV